MATGTGGSRAEAPGAGYADWHMDSFRSGGEALSRPRAVRIVAFEDLSRRHFAFAVTDPHLAGARPGQFAMLWVPGVDEVPMGVSEVDATAGGAWFLVDRVGDATTALGALRRGDRLGVRGPYGRPFALPRGGRVALVGGGTGTAIMLRAAQEAHAAGCHVEAIVGARTAGLLVWTERFAPYAAAVHPCTDDGSRGFRGFTTERLETLLAAGERFELVIACGPERMMHKVAAIAAAADIPCQVSVERYMKCGIGICGSCVMGDGLRACVEGPCLPTGELEHVPDWGRYHRGADGRRQPW